MRKLLTRENVLAVGLFLLIVLLIIVTAQPGQGPIYGNF